MLQLGWFGLTNPWLLAALVSLPVLWWLLRIIPPAPRYIRFPAIRFILGLEPEEQTSARTPPWLSTYMRFKDIELRYAGLARAMAIQNARVPDEPEPQSA